jgi:aspartate--ammonia ligase
MMNKKADLAGPGIGNYKDVAKVLPKDYKSLLDVKENPTHIWRTRCSGYYKIECQYELESR